MKLHVCKNIVSLDKSQEGYREFVETYLVKYENTTKPDYFKSTKGRRKFMTVKEKRYLYTETDSEILFPRGILELIPSSEYVMEETSSCDDTLIVPDLTSEEISKTLDCFDLREDQVVAVNKCLNAKRGIIQLPTATGKSAIVTSVIKRLHEVNPGMKSLVLAPTLSSVKNINDTFLENGIVSEVFGKPCKEIRSPVTSSLVQSLVALQEKFPDLLDEINAVFYDECLPGNSQILLADYSVTDMEDVYTSQDIVEVMSYDIDTGRYEPRRIVRKYKTEYKDRFCKVYYKDKETGRLSGVSCTRNHKIYTKGRGYVPAEDLTSDDYIKIDYPFARNWEILDSLTYTKVERVTYNVGKVVEYKYNLEVEGNHNYFANSVLVSNCHHLKCDTWNRLNTMLKNVEYSIGLSALSVDKKEIYISDFKDLSYTSSLIVGSSGRVLMHMDLSYYIDKGIVALPVVFRVNHNVTLPDQFDESSWSRLVKAGLMSTSRTDKVAEISSLFVRYSRKILILVSERDYAFKLCQFLVSYGITRFGISFGAGAGYVYGGLGPPTDDSLHNIDYESRESLEVLEMLSRDEIDVLIATSHLDESVNVKGLDVCILACGSKSDRRTIQRVGRVLRKSKNGKHAYIVDFTDEGSRVLSRHSRSRLKLYRDTIGVPEDLIYPDIKLEDIESSFKKLEDL